MQVTDISEDIVHGVATFIHSDRDLTRFNQTCRQIYIWTKREADRRKFALLYSAIDIDEDLVYDFHLKHSDGKDWRAARYIRDILNDLRIGCSVRTLRIRENVALKTLRDSLNPDFLRIACAYSIPVRDSEYVNKTIDSFSFIGAETKQTWKREALEGHASPLCMVLFTLCRKARVLDLSHASDQILTYLAPLLESFSSRWRLLAPEDEAAGISTSPLPPIVELRISKTTLQKVVKFFEIPSLRKVEGLMIDEDDEDPIDHNYIAEVGARCNVEELVLAPSNLNAETLAQLIKSVPKLKRLEYAMSASQWSIDHLGHSGDFDLAAIEHILEVMKRVKNLTGAVIKNRQLKFSLALVEDEMTKRWQLTVTQTERKENIRPEVGVCSTEPLVTA